MRAPHSLRNQVPDQYCEVFECFGCIAPSPDELMIAKITLIVPYFGSWPAFFRIWAESVQRNEAIEVLLVSDLPAPIFMAPNIKLVRMTLSEVADRVAAAIGLPVANSHPHKLCDFRPHFGLAFSDLLQGVDYWGYCDVDMIFGNLDPILELVRSGKYDVLSPAVHVVGHFALFRNSPNVNRLGLQIKNLESRLLQPFSTFMDESGITEVIRSVPGIASWLPPPGSTEVPLALTQTSYDAIFGLGDGLVFLTWLDQGKLKFVDYRSPPREILYFHFMALKAAVCWAGVDRLNGTNFCLAPWGLVAPAQRPESLSMRLRLKWFRLWQRQSPRAMLARFTPRWIRRLVRALEGENRRS